MPQILHLAGGGGWAWHSADFSWNKKKNIFPEINFGALTLLPSEAVGEGLIIEHDRADVGWKIWYWWGKWPQIIQCKLHQQGNLKPARGKWEEKNPSGILVFSDLFPTWWFLHEVTLWDHIRGAVPEPLWDKRFSLQSPRGGVAQNPCELRKSWEVFGICAPKIGTSRLQTQHGQEFPAGMEGRQDQAAFDG